MYYFFIHPLNLYNKLFLFYHNNICWHRKAYRVCCLVYCRPNSFYFIKNPPVLFGDSKFIVPAIIPLPS